MCPECSVQGTVGGMCWNSQNISGGGRGVGRAEAPRLGAGRGAGVQLCTKKGDFRQFGC